MQVEVVRGRRKVLFDILTTDPYMRVSQNPKLYIKRSEMLISRVRVMWTTTLYL